MKRALGAVLASALLVVFGISHAQGQQLDKLREQAAAEAQRSATASSEIANIKNRRELYGKPGVISYAVLLSRSGQVVMYLTVDGKCTSSKKRIEKPEEEKVITYGEDGKGNPKYKSVAIARQSDDGTFGSSAPYLYCFTADGRYIQWSGNYFLSDKPIELTTKPVVITKAGKGK